MAAKLFTSSKLITAIRAGRLDDVINALVAGGDIEEADMHGFAGLPLRTACFVGHPAIVRELLKRGADINAIASDGPGAPLRLAQRGKHQEIIALLLAHASEAMPADTAASSPMPNLEVPPVRFDEVATHEPDAAVDIEEIDLTAGYGVDTNLLTLDLLRLGEADDAADVHSAVPRRHR